MVAHWARIAGIDVDGLGVHGLRATAATNALENDADIAKIQAWLGHPNIHYYKDLRPAGEQARGFTYLQGGMLLTAFISVFMHLFVMRFG